MTINTDPKKISELLTRGVEEVIEKSSLEKKLKSGKQLRVKLGIDPTSPNIHLGRSIPLLKLRDFQELGHQIVFIIGDFTGVIGDTSDKDSERPMLTAKVVRENMKNYAAQAGKILDLKKCEVVKNSTWLKKLNYWDICEQADLFSVAEFIARENIKKRLDSGTRVSLREMLYPLMQGYDSVAIKADVELGGTDQRFNLLAGRKMQEKFGQPAQDLLLLGPLLEGTDGRKMSSSFGNTINLIDKPEEMFGKIMSAADNLIIKYFKLATRLPMVEVEEIANNLKNGANPRDAKIKLAGEIVRMYYSTKVAIKAHDNFVRTFSKKEKPAEMPEIKPVVYDLITVLIESEICKSKTEARQVIDQGGVKVNDEKIEARDYTHALNAGDVVQKGSRWFVRVK